MASDIISRILLAPPTILTLVGIEGGLTCVFATSRSGALYLPRYLLGLQVAAVTVTWPVFGRLSGRSYAM